MTPAGAALLAAVVALLLAAAALLGLRRRSAALAAEVERLRSAGGRWQAVDGARKRFLANLSHEIRAPMHGILGITDLLLADGLGADQRRQLELVRTSAEALLALAEDALDLSRIEADRLRLRPRDFGLGELAGEVVRLFGPDAAERGTTIFLDLDPALPGRFHADPVRLRQVLLNLVGNAVRFTRRGTVTLSIEAGEAAPAAAASVRFEVRDTGAGIAPEVQARLFEPFTRAEDSSPASAPTGSGLGLVISKRIVELMGGEIGFESTPGAGSTFWFRLPLAPAHRDDATPAAPLPDLAGARPARSRRRVLVVDDRASNRRVTLALLAGLGYDAAAAAGGERALAMLAESRFDAVLLDGEMPGLDGYETCRRLRRREAEESGDPRRPARRHLVVAVTARAGETARRRSLEAGMDDHLAKPFGPAELAAVLDRRLGVAAGEPAEEAGDDDLASRVERLRESGDGAAVALFLEQGEKDLATVRRALPRGEGEALAAAAHALAGSAGLLAAGALADAAATVAAAAHRGDLAACRAALPALEAAWSRTAERLRS